jgi:Phosphotransferase enzyme family
MAGARVWAREPVGRETLRTVLEAGLSAHLGRAVRVAHARVDLWQRSTNQIGHLRVALDSGECLPVVLKRFFPVAKDRSNNREILVYQHLLRGQRFGAPAFYGSVFDDRRRRYCLFLEDVGYITLKHGDLGDWLAAVEWLAEMHGEYLGRESELRRLGILNEQDARGFALMASDARRNLVAGAHPEAVRRFDRLMLGFDSLVANLLDRPRTLVHGDIFPHNVVLQNGPRVRPIDWESAAIGLAEWDLTQLVAGWGRSTKEIMIGRYLGLLSERTSHKIKTTDFMRALHRCQFLQVLRYFSWDVAECRNESAVNALLAKMQNSLESPQAMALLTDPVKDT